MKYKLYKKRWHGASPTLRPYRTPARTPQVHDTGTCMCTCLTHMYGQHYGIPNFVLCYSYTKLSCQNLLLGCGAATFLTAISIVSLRLC